MAQLSEKQLAAIDAYVAGMGKVAACRAAGYQFPEHDSNKIFTHPGVLAEIEKRREKVREKSAITVNTVLEGLMDAVRAAANSAELVMAWREVGKIIGAYEHAKEIKIDVTQRLEHITSVKQLERMSDSDLAQLAEVKDFILEGVYEEVEDGDGEAQED